MGARRQGRIIAVQTLYRFECTKEPLDALLDLSWMDGRKLSRLSADSLDFARLIVTGTVERLEEVDQAIKSQLEHWDFDRLNRVDLAIIRISVYCLMFQGDIPHTVTIDEAVDISKEYGTDDSYRFVNGVLDGIRKGLSPRPEPTLE